MKQVTEHTISQHIVNAVKKACVGKKCAFLSYGGGVVFESPSAPWVSYDCVVEDVTFRFTSESIPDSYASTPSYSLTLSGTNTKTGYKFHVDIDIRDVL